MMLEQQLSGRRWDDSVDGSQAPTSHSPSPENLPHGRSHSSSKSPTQSWASSNWKPGPPPPPIAPSSLPPAPSGPAPPPPVRPLQPPAPVEPVRESFMSQRQDRDTFGVHQNRVAQNNSKRNSFSANWEMQSSMTQETQDDIISWGKDRLDDNRRKDSWDQNGSITSTEPSKKMSFMSTDNWEMEVKTRAHPKEPAERPTFRTHQMNKIAQEREKKHSVSTTNTEKTEKIESKSLSLSHCLFVRRIVMWLLR